MYSFFMGRCVFNGGVQIYPEGFWLVVRINISSKFYMNGWE